jgi:hypothetical protein
MESGKTNLLIDKKWMARCYNPKSTATKKVSFEVNPKGIGGDGGMINVVLYKDKLGRMQNFNLCV